MKENLSREQHKGHQIESYQLGMRVQPVNLRTQKIKPYFPRYVFGRLGSFPLAESQPMTQTS